MTNGQPIGGNGEESIEGTNQRSKDAKERVVQAAETYAQNQEGNMLNLQPGQRLKNNPEYEIERKLGKGGFGITYLAKDKKGKQIVIKFADWSRSMFTPLDSSKSQQELVNEALRVQSCQHSHIVKMYKAINEGEIWGIVMEYIPGLDLSEVVREGGILSEEKAIIYITQIGEALTEIHKKGLLHRDVKPQNIIIRENKSEAVLIDFGIARQYDPKNPIPLTSLSTIGYSPIEQYSPDEEEGYFTDVYALASTLYFVLTKKVPEAAQARIIGRDKNKKDPLKAPKVINPNISTFVNKAILKGMEVYAINRPKSIEQWLNLLTNNEGEFFENEESGEGEEGEKANSPLSPISSPKVFDHTQNQLEFLGRTGLMGSAICLIAIALFKGSSISQPGLYLFLGILLFVFTQIKNKLSLENKIYQFIVAIIPTFAIFFTISHEAGISFLTLGVLAILAGILASVFMWIFQLITKFD